MLSDKDTDVTEERNINKIVSAFLMPEGKFKNIFKNHDINKTARYFNTSPEAAAIRAQEIGLINNINEVAILSNSGSLKKALVEIHTIMHSH
ncbi:ImmA/IrrE family metallo-endopeptidase [Paucilactobacillus hokkaidonensis]|uniref:ImmA/IrrE family metallo-endopeptidase n=1 Tax=Paucilactobacillus hokkaidonensis TaxID=1193095 RepID=UPI0006D27C41|nr:hypothetical protein [Paucilactobacillus hokkaidonensis]